MDSDNQKSTPHPHAPRKREESPRSGLEENLPYRIDGLEKAKAEPGMSQQDIAALERVIVKLKIKLAEKNEPKKEDKED